MAHDQVTCWQVECRRCRRQATPSSTCLRCASEHICCTQVQSDVLQLPAHAHTLTRATTACRLCTNAHLAHHGVMGMQLVQQLTSACHWPVAAHMLQPALISCPCCARASIASCPTFPQRSTPPLLSRTPTTTPLRAYVHIPVIAWTARFAADLAL